MPAYDIATARRWDVVVLPFPFSDRLAEKRRPALLISGDALHRGYGLLWVAMITSAKSTSWACDVVIEDLPAAGLSAPSVVRPAKIACIEAGRVVRAAGRIAASEALRVEYELANLVSNTARQD